MHATSPSHVATHANTAGQSALVALEARITRARIRMLYSHMPVTAWTLGGFILIIAGLIHIVQPGLPAWSTRIWLVLALLLAVARALHAQAYFRSIDRQALFWERSYLWLTGVFSVCWSALESCPNFVDTLT